MADLNIYVYPNTANDDSEARNIVDGLKVACDDVVSETAIDNHQIYVRYPHPNVSDSDYNDFYSSFRNWRSMNRTDKGCHLGVSNDIRGGRADGGNRSNPGYPAFTEARSAVIGANYSAGKYKNGAIQEAFHTFIDKDLNSVQQDINNSEHDLGKVYGDHDVTPMATTYDANVGSCSSSTYRNGFSHSPTNCTHSALEQTYYAYG